MRDADKPLLMSVEDVFTITGRGTVATGRIERGMVKVGEEVEIVDWANHAQPHAPESKFARNLVKVKQVTMSEFCFVALINPIYKRSCNRCSGSIKPHTKAKAQIYVLNKEEGGRHTPFSGLPPAVFLWYCRRYRSRRTSRGVEMVMPGDNQPLP